MDVNYDVVIIGGGAAGLSAAQYSARANLKTLVLEEMAMGGQALLIDEIENYPGILESVNGFDFIQGMHKQAERFGAEFKYLKCDSISKEGKYFKLATSEGDIICCAVIIATGAHHRHLGVPGEDEYAGKGVSYCATCDGPFFKNKKILVVGGGDAACDEANYLANLTDKVILVHRRDKFRAQPGVAERVMKNPNIEIRFNTVLKEIQGEGKVQKVVLAHTDKDEEYSEGMDAVFIFVGSVPQTQLVPDLKKDEGGSLITDQNMESSEKGIFVAGDVRSTPFRQLIVAAGDGAIAAHSAANYIEDVRETC